MYFTLAEVRSQIMPTDIRNAATELADIFSLMEGAATIEAPPSIKDVIDSLQKLINVLSPKAREDLEGDGDGDSDPDNVCVQTRVGEALLEVAEALHFDLYEKQFSSDERDTLAKSGKALPGGGFPIPDLASLKDAMQAYGRAKDKTATKALLLKRAKELKAGADVIERIQNFKEARTTKHDDAFAGMSPKEQKAHLTDDHGVHADTPGLKIPPKRFAMHGDAHKAPSKESSFPCDLNGDTIIPLTESAVRPDGTAKVKIIAPGWGSSGYYSREVLERDGPKVFTPGLHMFWDHPTRSEESDRPERSLKDLTAVLESPARWEDTGEHGPGLYADARVFKPYHGAVNEMAKHIGVSIRASGKGTTGTVEGRKGTLIEELTSARSIDFVTLPGAGGKVLPLFESYRGKNDESIRTEEYNMELEEVKKKLGEAETESVRLREALMLRDARDIATEELAKVESIPVPSRRRLVETVCADPPSKDGKLDKDKFIEAIRDAVKSEANYLQEVLGTGKIRGMGGTSSTSTDNGNSEAIRKELAEAFQTIGLDESVARLAANGRR